MSWKQKTCIAILLLVARMVSDEDWKVDIKNLANHIATYRGEEA